MHHRHGLWRALHLLFKQPMNSLLLRIIQRGRIEPEQQLFTLRRRQHPTAAPTAPQRSAPIPPPDSPARPAYNRRSVAHRRGSRLYRQAEAHVVIVHRKRQRVVGALAATEAFDTLPGIQRLLADLTGTVPVVEQGAEQWRRRRHATATLGQRQGGVLMTQQRGEPAMGRLERGPGAQAPRSRRSGKVLINIPNARSAPAPPCIRPSNTVRTQLSRVGTSDPAPGPRPGAPGSPR